MNLEKRQISQVDEFQMLYVNFLSISKGSTAPLPCMLREASMEQSGKGGKRVIEGKAGRHALSQHQLAQGHSNYEDLCQTCPLSNMKEDICFSDPPFQTTHPC